MVANVRTKDLPALQDVLDALDDEDCRDIIRSLEKPMSASDLAETADIPLSTTYRKLELLSAASLVEKQLQFDPDGRHTTNYVIAFEEVRIALDEQRTFDIAIKQRRGDAADRLSDLWLEVQKET